MKRMLPHLYNPSWLFLFLTFTFLVSTQQFAQPAQGCDDPLRYILPVFQDVQVTNVAYGTNKTATGQNKLLTMDVYEPVGDVQETRPVIIWVHGGSFILGSRNDMRSFAEAYARLGYVTASIDYRLFPLTLGIPDSVQALDAAIKAVGDLKAAIRHFRKDADTENRFRIDPDHIIIGGLSAGAITALHAAYLTEEDDMPPHVEQVIEANGGIEGSSGDAENMRYSSDVEAVINLSGALYRPEWVSENDPPLVSFHAKDDDVVPFLSDFARIGGIPIIRLNGTGVIHERANDIGLNNYFLATESGGHTGIYTEAAYEAQRIEFTSSASAFLKVIICEDLGTNTLAYDRVEVESVFPVPAETEVSIRWKAGYAGGDIRVHVSDLQGRTVRQLRTPDSGLLVMDRDGLPSGMYLMQLLDMGGAPLASPVKILFD